MAQTPGGQQTNYKTFLHNPQTQKTTAYDGEEDPILSEILDNYLTGVEVRRTPLPQINEQTIEDRIAHWKNLWYGNVPGRFQNISAEDMSIFYKFTRNLTKRFLANLSQAEMNVKIKAQEDSGYEDRDLAQTMKALNDYENERADQEKVFMDTAMEAAVAGTAFVKETFVKEAREVEVPTEFEPDTGEVKTEKQEKITYLGCKTELRRIENIVFPNLYTDNIQEQEWIIDVKRVHKGTFEAKYGRFEGADRVVPGVFSFPASWANNTGGRNHNEFALNSSEEVMILEWYRKRDNKMVVVANGVKLYDSVIPYEHGEYPYIRYVHEDFEGHPLMYGNSFVSNIEGEQQMFNVMFNMLARKAMWAAYPQMLTQNEDDMLEDEKMDIGEIKKVSDISGVTIQQFPGLDNGDMAMIGKLQELVQENSGNVKGGGDMFSPAGGKVSVRQALLSQKESRQQVGFNAQNLEAGEKRRVQQRLANLRQFYTLPKMSMLSDSDAQTYKTLKIIRQNNMPLSDNERGTKYVHIYDDDKIKEEDEEKIVRQLDIAEEIAEQNGENMEAVALSKSMLRRFSYHVQVVRNSTYAENKSMELADRMEVAKVALNLAPNLDRQNMLEFILEATDYDMSSFLTAPDKEGMMQQLNQAQQQMRQQGGGQGPGGQQISPQAQQALQKIQQQGQPPPRQEKSAAEAGKVVEEVVAPE